MSISTLSTTQKRLLRLVGLTVLTAAAGTALVWHEERGEQRQAQKQAAQRLFDSADVQAVQEVRLSTPQGNFVVRRDAASPTGWNIIEPMATPAEASTVETLVQTATDLRITSRVGGGPQDDLRQNVEPPADLALFGLQPPQNSLTLVTQLGAPAVLHIGKKNSYDGTLYVKRAERPDVGLTDGAFAYQLDVDLYKLREKRPLVFTPDNVTLLRIAPRVGKTIVLQRQGENFEVKEPFAADADAAQVGQIMSALEGLRAKAFVAESATTPQRRRPFGLDIPTTTVTLQFKTGTPQTLLFGQAINAGELGYYVSNGTQVLALGSDWALKKLGMDPQLLRDMHVLSFAPEAVHEVRITRGQASLVLHQAHDEKTEQTRWTTPGANPEEAQTSKVVALLLKLKNLRADEVVLSAAAPASLQAHGLAAPVLRVVLLGADKAPLAELLVGDEVGTQRYVANGASGRLDKVQKNDVDDVSVTLSDYQQTTTATNN